MGHPSLLSPERTKSSASGTRRDPEPGTGILAKMGAYAGAGGLTKNSAGNCAWQALRRWLGGRRAWPGQSKASSITNPRSIAGSPRDARPASRVLVAGCLVAAPQSAVHRHPDDCADVEDCKAYPPDGGVNLRVHYPGFDRRHELVRVGHSCGGSAVCAPRPTRGPGGSRCADRLCCEPIGWRGPGGTGRCSM